MTAAASSQRNDKTPTSPSATEDRQAAVREVLVHTARIQLASISAASRFISGWVQSADRYTQALSDELLERVHGETASSELIGRLASVSSLHLRELTALPNAAVSHFNSEGSKPAKAGKRTRESARRSARA
jgi:hypothetical protein